MRHFHHEFQVNAPIERVAEFHHNPQALKTLTLPPISIKFVQIPGKRFVLPTQNYLIMLFEYSPHEPGWGHNPGRIPDQVYRG